MINFSKKYQFATRLCLDNQNIEIVSSMKVLGTIIDNRLSWDQNCAMLIKKVNARMQLLQKAKSFGATLKQLKHLWITYCRNILERSCTVWHSSLTDQNSDDLERTQKTTSFREENHVKIMTSS